MGRWWDAGDRSNQNGHRRETPVPCRARPRCAGPDFLSDFIAFYRILSYFYRVLSDFIGFYRIFIGFYRILSDFIGFYWILLDSTGGTLVNAMKFE